MIGHETDCLSSSVIDELLTGQCGDDQLQSAIQHLNGCHECQQRLESVVNSLAETDEDFRMLSESVPEPDDHLKRVTESLCSQGAPTRDLELNQPASAVSNETHLGDYQLLGQIGRGGMGQVYKAYDPKLQREVALKVLNRSLPQSITAEERFQREACAAAAINHPHVVTLHAIENDENNSWLVMEYVNGVSLEERLKLKPQLQFDEIIRIGAEIANGLQAAHDRGLIHRDIKPGNVLLQHADGQVKIADFGLARALDDPRLTREGYISGTPEFTSPEQAAGLPVDHRADLFSLGSVLYTMCAGKPPFAADNSLAVLQRVRNDSPEPLQELNPEIPPALQEIIEQLLQKNPDDRIQSAAEVESLLRQVGEGTSRKRAATKLERTRRSTRMPLALLLLVGLPLIGLATWPLMGQSTLVPTFQAVRNGFQEQEPAGNQIPTQRMQIVTPDSNMRERIRMQKDAIPETIDPNLIHKFEGHEGPVKAAVFVGNGKQIVSGSGWPTGDRSLRLWNAGSGEMVRMFDVSELPLHPEQTGGREVPGEIMCVAATPDGKHVVAGAAGGGLGLWNIKTGEMVRSYVGHEGTIYGLAVSPDGSLMASTSRDSSARVWNLETGEELLRISAGRSWGRCVAFTPDNQSLLVGGYDKQLRIWNLASGECTATLPFKEWIWDVDVTSNGKIAAVCTGRLCVIRELETNKNLHVLQHPESLTAVAFSPDGSRLLTGNYDMQARLWDVRTGELLETFKGHRGWVWDVAFSPDGKTALTAGGGRFVPNQGTVAGIDFAMRTWKLPAREVRVLGGK